jgi:hypothetical protein
VAAKHLLELHIDAFDPFARAQRASAASSRQSAAVSFSAGRAMVCFSAAA